MNTVDAPNANCAVQLNCDSQRVEWVIIHVNENNTILCDIDLQIFIIIWKTKKNELCKQKYWNVLFMLMKVFKIIVKILLQ